MVAISKRFILNLVLLSFTSAAFGYLPRGRFNGNVFSRPEIPRTVAADGPVASKNGTQLPPYSTIYYFDQLIDHNNPSLGTFQQRYWHTYEFYEDGGPIIFMTPGEVNAEGYTGYLTNRTINGMISQQQNGSTIVLEHRFYGLSNPYNNLTVQSLQLLTVQQALDDFEYFANNVVLPMPNGANLGPSQAPWVFVGGSYSGALASYVRVNKPDTFFASYASSGVVEAILDYWKYFEPIRQNMAANCSADVEAVIRHVDDVFSRSDETAIQALKANWGMQVVTHVDDVAGALRYNLWDWQSLQPYSGGGLYFEFCDALEVKNGVNAPASGWGLEHALTAWGSFWNTTYYALVCGDTDAETCLGSYNASQEYWTDVSVDNSGRSWYWQVCTEFGFLQDGPPPTAGVPAVVSHIIQPPYDFRQCEMMFPAQYIHSTPSPAVGQINSAYHGWNVKTNRLFFANGVRDPWRDATVSADDSPARSTGSQPIHVGDGFHCSDLLAASGQVDATVAAVQKAGLAAMATWLAEWSPSSQK